ncbi:hypothetical protein BIFGAL_02509 [Bifidobacterium gallicum DSM 20093 = LMG 11596]|uniref:Uncharacterized protein n=1 Tax=Bifidobacterium gallicum DSM 20093 = LMG 11596 TaxID=561180 RepID=D1NRV8_9BIFI|nr:hypothetical protein BIFGAL_02509 [Bifidobacterium gallicum DSM 20093 = LMG 11596]
MLTYGNVISPSVDIPPPWACDEACPESIAIRTNHMRCNTEE